MRIAFVGTERLPCPPIRGGAPQILMEATASILCKRHDITVFSRSDKRMPDFEKIKGATHVRFSKSNYLNHVVNYLKKQSPFDIVQIFNRHEYAKKIKKEFPKSKVILSLHNEKKFGSDIADLADHILTVSQFISGTVTKRWPQAAQKIKTVYSGVDHRRFQSIWSEEAASLRKKMREKFGFSKDDKVILYVGRLSENKGAHILLDAMKEIVAKHNNTRLFIVGYRKFDDNKPNSYMLDLYNKSRQKPLQGKVIFSDFVKPSRIDRYYLIGDLFVCASQWDEPLARVHYEAMAAGLPIITTRRGGNPEVVEPYQTGIVVNRHDHPGEMAAQITYLLTHPMEAEKMGKQGRKWAENKFNFVRVAREYEQLYSSLRGGLSR